MEQYINIQPKDLILVSSKISINVLLVELNIRAIIRVRFYSNDSKLLNTEEFILEGNDYMSWQNDNYLINYVCEKYNIDLP
jgi:hypothetical protein